MRRFVWVGLAAMLAGVFLAGLAEGWETDTYQDKRAATLTKRMKTYCVGRFLIDMPEAAQLEFGQANIDGFDISTFPETLEEFQRRLADRETQLNLMPGYSAGKRNLEFVREVKTDRGMIGKVFEHSRRVTEGTRARGLGLERYRHEGIAIEALVHAGGISFDLASEYYDPEQIENLPKLLAQLSPNPAGRVPSEPGFCIERAFFREPLTAAQGEQIMMFVLLPDHPDVEFMLTLSAGNRPDEEGLLKRSGTAEGHLSLADKVRLTRLRAGPRRIGSLTGEELILDGA